MKTGIKKTVTCPGRASRAGCFLVLFLLAGWLATNAQAGVVFTSLHSFTGTNDGKYPYAGLVQGNDGNFYGTTEAGGTNGFGTVFKISTNGALTSLYSFTGTNDGANPYASLVPGSNGFFYGTTYSGGTSNSGTVFKISSNGAFTSLHSFTNGPTGDGAHPRAGLVQGSDGNFYGTTANGGALGYGSGSMGYGTVFKISTNGTLTRLYSFTDDSGLGEGAIPYAGLVQGSNGNFYGTAAGGGVFGWGTVFQIATNGAINYMLLTLA